MSVGAQANPPQRFGERALEDFVQPSQEDPLVIATAAVYGEDDRACSNESQAGGLVEPAARDVKRGVVAGRLDALEHVEVEVVARDGSRDLAGPRLDGAAVKCDDGDGRWPENDCNSVVDARLLALGELSEAAVPVYHLAGRTPSQ
jgi:hypothetical protein